MTQSVVLAQFRKYLEVTWVEYAARLHKEYSGVKDPDKIKQAKQRVEEESKYLKRLSESLESGHCFGLAVCHGAMARVGKQIWWEDALVHIYHWDGDVKSLDTPIVLRDARNGRTITMRQIFELAMNYVVHSHTVISSEAKDFSFGTVTQQNVLLPLEGDNDANVIPQHMEILDEDGSVQTIKQNQRVAGHFSKEQLGALLQEATFSKNICLIHSPSHTMHISCLGQGRWQLYEPNASHESLEAIHFEGTKDEVIDKVFACMHTQSLAIEVASIDSRAEINLSAYEDMLRRAPASLITTESLFLLAMETPDRLLELLQLAARVPDGRELKAIFANIIANAAYSKNRNALHVIAHYAPAALPALFALADQTREGAIIAKAIADGLTAKDEKGATAFQVISAKSPEGLTALFQLAAREGTINFINILARALVEKVSGTQVTAVDVMATREPGTLSKLFVLANGEHSKSLRVALAKVLHEELPNNYLRLHFMVKSAPDALPALWKLMTKMHEGKALEALAQGHSPAANALRTAIADALAAKEDNNRVVFHTILRDSPADIRNLIALVLSDHQKPENLYSLLQALAATVDGKTGWQCITESADTVQKQEILQMISARLNDLTTPDLVQFGREINRALTDEQAKYRGLCSERNTLFRGGQYGKTSIWQELIKKSQDILRSRKDALKEPGVEEVLKIKSGR